MESIATLGTITGLALTSGLRLYSTILVVGLGMRFGWFTPPPALGQLEVFSSTPVLIIAGVLYVVEFLADKIPWVDTVWDSIHTVIRPLGAGVVAATALGDVDPAMKTGAFLLSGAVALSSHSAKAGTRIAANHSPEPFSNIGLSLAEDALSVGGVWLAFTHPVAMLIVVVIVVALILWLVPKLIRLLVAQARRVRDALTGNRPKIAALRDAALDRGLDQPGKGVDLVDGRIDVGRHPDP